MSKFYENNKYITKIFVCSIIIIISYILSKDEPEWFTNAEEWFNLVFQLSIGFIINFLFYITQVYLPQKRQYMQAYKCINIRIGNIIEHMDEIFSELGKMYIDNFCNTNNLTDEQLLKMLNKLNFNDKTNIIYSPRLNMDDQYMTVKEWMVSRMEFVEHGIDKLYNYYNMYISPELMEVLEDIMKSNMHNGMGRGFLQAPNEISFKNLTTDLYFVQYYQLMKQLEKEKNIYLTA